MKNKQVALDFLHVYLPKEIQAMCDFGTLHIENGSFIEENLKESCVDMLYSLQIQGKPGYIYFLIEHQSKPDNSMPARMLSYQAAIAKQHFEKHHKIPLIIPLMMYCGEQTPYPFSCNLQDYLESPEISQDILSHNFKLIDLTKMPYHELATHKGLATIEIVLKHVKDRDQQAALEFLRAHKTLEAIIYSHEISTALSLYIAHYAGNPEFLMELTEHVQSPYKEDMVSIAQQLEERGIQKGRQEGIQKGVQQATLDIASNLLKRGITMEFVAESTKLSLHTVRKIANGELVNLDDHSSPGSF